MHPPASLAPLATDSSVVYYPLPEDMKEEVTAAVEFFLKMVETPHLTPSIPRLGRNLTKALSNKYKDHWFLDSPQRGQAYRCIEVCDNQSADRVLAEAVAESGLQYSELRLPAELCVWVDPKEVACRFGDELGSFLPIYINENGKKRKFVDKFNFSRLCERSVIGPVHMGRSSNAAIERSTMRRVIGGTEESMEVELERGATIPLPDPSSILLTPPTTPPFTPTHSPSSPPPTSPPSSPLETLDESYFVSQSAYTKRRYSGSPPLPTTRSSINSNYHQQHQYSTVNNNNNNSLHHLHHHVQQQPRHHHSHAPSPAPHPIIHSNHSSAAVSPTHHQYSQHQHHHHHATNYNIYSNNMNNNSGVSNGLFSRSPPRGNGGFSGGAKTGGGKWMSYGSNANLTTSGAVVTSNVNANKNINNNNHLHHHPHHHHVNQTQQQQHQQQQQQYYHQQQLQGRGGSAGGHERHQWYGHRTLARV